MFHSLKNKIMIHRMLFIKSIIKKSVLWLIDIPQLNIKIQYVFRPINKHRKVITDVLKNINYSQAIDYGCGEGLFSVCFDRSKYNGYDTDIKRIICAKKMFQGYKFFSKLHTGEDYDLFFFNNVLHHINLSQIRDLLSWVVNFSRKETTIMIIELKPTYEQNNLFCRLMLDLESSIHYSKQRPVDFYKREFKKAGYELIYKKDLGVFFLLLFRS